MGTEGNRIVLAYLTGVLLRPEVVNLSCKLNQLFKSNLNSKAAEMS